MRTRLGVVVATAALAMGMASVPPVSQEAQAATWKPTPGALFNVPRSTADRETRLERQVIAAIKHARPRSTIKMVMFSFDRMQVADALLDVHKRKKVAVQVIVNGHERPRAQRKLKKRLGTKRSHRSFYYQCKASCRGQGDVQHSKFVLFSATGAAKRTVMLGSLNMKLNGVRNQFNDLLTLNDQTKLYDVLDRVFDEMKRDRLAKPSYLEETIDRKTKLYVLPFPRAGAATRKTKWTIARDPITKLLAPIQCLGANTPSGRTLVRVNMHAWDGERGIAIAKKFLALFRAGCDVRIQVGFAGYEIRKIFATKTARGYMPVRSTGFDTDEDGEIDLYSHEKILLVRGHYGASRGKRMIVTGSSNYQNGGQYGDELILRVFGRKLYKQYVSNWDWSWKYHTHGFARGYVMPGTNSERTSGTEILIDGLGRNSPEWRDQ